MKNHQVYGSGMIAKAFSGQNLPKNVVVIAAGVSNSQEVLCSEFRREKDLLEKVILENQGKKIIYFSSCSVYQSNVTPYVSHKLAMEKLIAETAESFNIFRLPQVVGVTKNNTIISYFVKSLIKRDIITVYDNAKRYFIDVDDVVRIVLFLISNKSCNSVIDICNDKRTSVLKVVHEIGKVLSIEPLVNSIDAGEDYDIPCLKLKATLSNDDYIYNPDYVSNLLKKYVPLLASQHSNPPTLIRF